MAVKDIFTRTTIIPTDRTRGNVQNLSRDEQAILNVQQERYKTQQMAHYTRRSIPIKESVVSKIQQKIDDYKQRIEKAQKDIEYYDRKQNETKSDSSRESYRRSEDSAYNKKSSYEEGLRVLQQELDKYNKITDPLEIVGIGDEWGKEVVNYASDVRYNEYRYLEARDEQKRQFREYKNSPEFKDLQATYGLNSNISQSDFNKFVNKINTTGQYNVKTGEFYPTTNKDWAPKGVNMNDVVFINQGLTMWDKVETKLSDGTKLLQFKNPGNPNDIINIGTILPTKEVKPMQTPTKEVTVSLGPNPIKFKDAVKTAPTLGEKIKVVYGYLDKSMGGYLPGGASPAEVKAAKIAQPRAEEFHGLASQSSEEFVKNVLASGNKYTWKGNEYDKEIVQKAFNYVKSKEAENDYTNNVIPMVEVYSKEYNDAVSAAIGSNSPNTVKMIEDAYKVLENKIKVEEDKWTERTEKSFEEGKKQAQEMEIKMMWNELTIPKIAATAAIAATGLVLAPAAGGAFGANIAVAATTINTLGIGFGAVSVISTMDRIYQEKQNGTLSKEKLFAIVGPQIVYVTIAIAVGTVSGKIGIAQFKKAQTEFLMNINEQLPGNVKLQNEIFTKSNLARGYAEMRYGKYTMRLNINEGMLANLQIQNAVLAEGVNKVTKFKAAGIREEGMIRKAIDDAILVGKERGYVIENSIGKVESSLVTKITGKTAASKEWYTARVFVNNKQADLLFTLSKQGKMMNTYVVVSKELQNGYWYVNVGKVVNYRQLSIPVEGGSPLKVSQFEQIRPVGNYIVQNKGSSYGSILKADGTAIDVQKNAALVKQILGVALDKPDTSLFSFLTEKNPLKASSIGRARVGTRTNIDSIRLSTSLSQKATFKDGELTIPSSKKSLFLDMGRGKTEDPLRIDFDSLGKWFPEGNKGGGKSSVPKVSTKNAPLLNTDYLLGGKTPKIKPSSPSGTSSTFNTDYLLGSKSSGGKLDSIFAGTGKYELTGFESPSLVNTGKPSSILNMDYLLGVTPSPKIGKVTMTSPSIKETSPFVFGGFGALQTKTSSGTKQAQPQHQRSQDIFGVQELSKNLTRTISAPIEQTKQDTRTRQALTQKQKQVQLQKQQQLQRTQDIFGFQSMFRPTPQITPKINKPKIDPFKWEFPKKEQEPPKKKVQKTTGLLDWGYVAEVRRQGKFKPVARTASAEEAFWIGKGVVDNTLGASFRVRKVEKENKKKTKPIEDIFSWGIPKDFYTKQDKGETIFIEKRGKRISTRGEKREIQQARKRKKSSSFLDWWK